MNTLQIILISVGLAMDAFAVSLAAGTLTCVQCKRARFRLSFHFGLFQAFMPVIGWFLAHQVVHYIKAVDHWIAFALLGFIGVKMIYESLHPDDKTQLTNPSKGWSLVMLSIATSIDALAVGLSLALLGVEIWVPALYIGVITASMSLAGIHLGKKLGEKFGQIMERIGGIILIFIGLRILISHVFGL